MRNINLPLNQHKTITVRKIMKLRKIKKIKKIKKRKTKVPKAPIVNSDQGIKMEEDKIKNNESNSGNNSIQQIIQRPNSLREEFDIFRNESDAFLKIPNYNIFNINSISTNFIFNDSFSTQNEICSSPTLSRFIQISEDHAFNFLNTHHHMFLENIDEDENEDEYENEDEREFLSSRPTIFPQQNNNRNDLITENPTNNEHRIPLNNINNSNGNGFNPQNRNTNNNNPNIMHFHFNFPNLDFDDYFFRFPRISRTEIRNIKNKLTKIRFRRSLSSNGNCERCIICCEDFKNYQNVYNLPCHHLFHVQCLNKEIKYRQKCPMCRKEL